MTKPIGSDRPSYPPSFTPTQDRQNRKMEWGADALSAPITPTHRAPMIDRSKVDPEILKAAEGMEALFLDYMLKVMRETIPKNEMDLENSATQIFRGMQDSKYAEMAAHRGGVGLAEPIIDYLQSRSYNLNQGQGVPNLRSEPGHKPEKSFEGKTEETKEKP